MTAAVPGADRFPKCPAAWYLFGSTRSLRNGPVSKDMFGRRLLAFQTTDGRVTVMEALCAHLAADLARGKLEGDTIQCPFHGWRYNADGKCTHIPGSETIPSFARQQCYPVEVRHGLVFFFLGPEPLFPLPFFLDEQPGDFTAGRPFTFVGNCSWYLLASNGFDTAHFQVVHDRTLVGPPVIDTPADYVRRIQFTSRVTGDSAADRFIRTAIGSTADVSIVNWGGMMSVVTAGFRRSRSYMLICKRPLQPHKTLVDVIVFAPRPRRLLGWLPKRVSLEIRRWLTKAFLADDVNRLSGIVYSPQSLTSCDQELADFFHWLADLPQRRQSTAVQRPAQDRPLPAPSFPSG